MKLGLCRLDGKVCTNKMRWNTSGRDVMASHDLLHTCAVRSTGALHWQNKAHQEQSCWACEPRASPMRPSLRLQQHDMVHGVWRANTLHNSPQTKPRTRTRTCLSTAIQTATYAPFLQPQKATKGQGACVPAATTNTTMNPTSTSNNHSITITWDRVQRRHHWFH